MKFSGIVGIWILAGCCTVALAAEKAPPAPATSETDRQIEERFPALAERLKRLRTEDPERYRRMVQNLRSPARPGTGKGKNARNEEIESVNAKRAVLREEIRKLAEQYHSSTGEEKKKAFSALREKTREAYDLTTRFRSLLIDVGEKRLEEAKRKLELAKSSLELRKKNRETHIRLFLQRFEKGGTPDESARKAGDRSEIKTSAKKRSEASQ